MRHITLNQSIQAFGNSIKIALKSFPNLLMAVLAILLILIFFLLVFSVLMAALNVPQTQCKSIVLIISFAIIGVTGLGTPDTFSSMLFKNQEIRYDSLIKIWSGKMYTLKLFILLVFYILAITPLWLFTLSKSPLMNTMSLFHVLTSAVSSIIFTVFLLASFFTAPKGRGLSLFTAVEKSLETTFTNLSVPATVFITNTLFMVFCFAVSHVLGLIGTFITLTVSAIILSSALVIFLCKVGYYVVPADNNQN